MNNINNTLLNEFSYHDGKVMLAEKRNNNFILTFKDGWNENQINEIEFIDCEKIPDYDLTNSTLINLNSIKYDDNYYFSLEVPSKEKNIFIPEIITFKSRNINAKLYLDDKLIKSEEL